MGEKAIQKKAAKQAKRQQTQGGVDPFGQIRSKGALQDAIDTGDPFTALEKAVPKPVGK